MSVKAVQFRFGASLRIMNAPLLHSEFSAAMGTPTESHVRGEPVFGDDSKRWPNDIWLKQADVDECQDINVHLSWIAEFMKPHKHKFKDWMDRGARIDIYMYYDCSHEHRGFELNPNSLGIFPELGIPLSVSIMR